MAYTGKSKLKDIMKNPFGMDAMTTVATSLGIDMKLLQSPIVGAMTLSAVAKLSKGLMDDDFIKAFCEKLSVYENAPKIENPAQITRHWWKEAVFYQIYPSSFCDSNGDGMGDLRGIISKLDYLAQLGITALWLSPVYPSPFDDNGYDISDYRNINKQFGTLEDMDALLSGAHARGIRIIMDLVVNHTSDEHVWFQNAQQSEDSPYRDYYIWRKGTREHTPNNWTSMFSGSSWEYSEQTKSWYLHCFSKKQPDLNWQNPKVRAEVAELVNFWYDRGIDGFRLDVINMIDKPDGLPDGSPALGTLMDVIGCEHYFFGPRAHDYLQELYKNTAEGRDVFTVGETPAVGMQLGRLFTAEQRKELNTVFSFEHLYSPGTQRQSAAKFDLHHLKENLTGWQLNYGNACWSSLFTDNHDNPRMVSRADSSGNYRELLAKLLATVLLTLKGTPFLYQGQEIGMTNSRFDTLDDFRDVESLNYYKQHKDDMPHDKLMDILRGMTRDHARTPMQWNAQAQAGFTTGTPWIAVNPNYTKINAESEQQNNDSVFHWYRKLIALRKSAPALVYGDFAPLTSKQRDLFCYTRTLDGESYYIEMNLSEKNANRVVPTASFELIMSNYPAPASQLRAYEANIYKKK